MPPPKSPISSSHVGVKGRHVNLGDTADSWSPGQSDTSWDSQPRRPSALPRGREPGVCRPGCGVWAALRSGCQLTGLSPGVLALKGQMAAFGTWRTALGGSGGDHGGKCVAAGVLLGWLCPPLPRRTRSPRPGLPLPSAACTGRAGAAARTCGGGGGSELGQL